MILPDHLERISKKLNYVRGRRPGPFGLDGNRRQLGRPLPESSIEAFESRQGIRLPEDFRLFITTLGNGGPGPGHGWSPFNPQDKWYKETENWSQPWKNPNFLPDDEWDAIAECGTIFLNEHGCGMFDFLVVTGPEAGTVWFSGSVCEVSPELSASQHQELFAQGTSRETILEILQEAAFPQRVSFLEHYENWLDSFLANVPPDRFS